LAKEELHANAGLQERLVQVEAQNKGRLVGTPQQVPNAGGYIKSFVTEVEEVYYRVYSGDAKKGRYLTKIPPKNSPLAKGGLALPDANQAEYIQEVIVPKGVRLQRSRALPAFDKRGGMEQFEVINQDDLSKLKFKDGKPLNDND